MALENRAETKTFYLTPSGGKLQLSSKEKRDGYEERIVETSKGDRVTKYVKEFDGASGLIHDVTTEDSEYGKKWIVTLKDSGETYIIKFPYSSGYADTFLQQIENVDLSLPVYISPSYKEVEKDGKIRRQTALWIKQNDQTIKFKYTKDNPQGRPEKVETKFKGKTVWDDTDRLVFHENAIKNMLNNFKFNQATNATVEDTFPDIDDNELPF
jgi:hypothetical protein